jgi:hypothetical protein
MRTIVNDRSGERPCHGTTERDFESPLEYKSASEHDFILSCLKTDAPYHHLQSSER